VLDETRAAERDADGFVPFHAAGTRVRGAFRCAQCGYGVAVTGFLPLCPMCLGTSWEPELRPSFGRSGEVVELRSREF
jgi:hypothetical protein